MAQSPIVAPLELCSPDYNIYRYTDQIYKIVHFKSCGGSVRLVDRSKFQSYDNKLPAALSRARRVVLEIALCNSWDWFCTFTISKDKHDRYDLAGWRKKFTQWIRDQRKLGSNISYLLVPECHKDGAWHMHGFFSGVDKFLVSFADEAKSGLDVPLRLVEGGFYDWPGYRKNFGFCSFGLIHNKIAASFYIVKYLTKEMQESAVPVGANLYYCSQGLNRASLHGEVYGHCDYLHGFLNNHYDFCDTGMTKLSHDLGWDFALEYMNVEPLNEISSPDPEIAGAVDSYFEIIQDVLEAFQ